MMNRRQFFIKSSGGVIASTIASLSMKSFSAVFDKTWADKLVDSGLSSKQWEILFAVQNHLLPSEPGKPGAQDVNTLSYFRSIITDPDYDQGDRNFVKTGLIELEGISIKLMKTTFIDLSATQREQALRAFEKEPNGYPWITTQLNYILEALLTDPLYGGNPNGIGWKWLEHTPGFPRPNKQYFDL